MRQPSPQASALCASQLPDLRPPSKAPHRPQWPHSSSCLSVLSLCTLCCSLSLGSQPATLSLQVQLTFLQIQCLTRRKHVNGNQSLLSTHSGSDTVLKTFTGYPFLNFLFFMQVLFVIPFYRGGDWGLERIPAQYPIGSRCWSWDLNTGSLILEHNHLITAHRCPFQFLISS